MVSVPLIRHDADAAGTCICTASKVEPPRRARANHQPTQAYPQAKTGHLRRRRSQATSRLGRAMTAYERSTHTNDLQVGPRMLLD